MRPCFFLRRPVLQQFRRRSSISIKKILLLFVLLFLLLGLYTEKQLPVVREDIQQAALRTYAQTCIAETVQEFLPDVPVQTDGDLVALDTYLWNQTKADLTCALQEALSGKAVIWIPFGNLTGLSLLNGHGIKIPVAFAVEGMASVELETDLSSAGINRTKYSVEMVVCAELYSSSIAFPEIVTVRTAYPICETVLEGEVPQFVSGIK